MPWAGAGSVGVMFWVGAGSAGVMFWAGAGSAGVMLWAGAGSACVANTLIPAHSESTSARAKTTAKDLFIIFLL